MNTDLTPYSLQDAQNKIGIDKMNEMFDKVKNRGIDVIVVVRYDRFGRNVNNVLTDMARLGMYGCRLIAGDAYCKNDTPVL